MVSISTDKRKKIKKVRVSYFDHAKGKWANKYFMSRRQAGEFAARQREIEDAYRGGLKIPTKEMMLKNYMPEFWARYKTKSYYKNAKYLYQKHIEPVFRDQIISQIRQDQILKLRDRSAQTLSSQSVNHILNLFSSIFREAALDGVAEVNPVRGVEKLKIIRRQTPRTLTDGEIELILSKADDQIWPGLMLGLNCGLRKSEIFQARIEDFNLKTRVLTVDNRPEAGERTKSGRVRYVPIPGAIEEMIRSLGRTKGPVVGVSRMTFRRAWEGLIRRLGLKGVGLHSLRHTWATRHIEAGTPLVDLQAIGGWADIKTLQRYTHNQPGYLANVRDRVNIQAQNRHKKESKIIKFKPKVS